MIIKRFQNKMLNYYVEVLCSLLRFSWFLVVIHCYKKRLCLFSKYSIFIIKISYMALDLKIILYTNDACTDLFLQDDTGVYTASNIGGYETPNQSRAGVTSVTIILTILGTTLTYDFTVSSGTITAATATLAGGTPVDILSDMTSTVWPFTDANPFNITPSAWSETLPALEDQAYPVQYTIIGSQTYSTTSSYLVTCAVCCCVSKQMLSVNINDKAKLVDNLIPTAYLAVADYANEDGLTSKANDFINKAAAICGNSDCGCC